MSEPLDFTKISERMNASSIIINMACMRNEDVSSVELWKSDLKKIEASLVDIPALLKKLEEVEERAEIFEKNFAELRKTIRGVSL